MVWLSADDTISEAEKAAYGSKTAFRVIPKAGFEGFSIFVNNRELKKDADGNYIYSEKTDGNTVWHKPDGFCTKMRNFMYRTKQRL